MTQNSIPLLEMMLRDRLKSFNTSLKSYDSKNKTKSKSTKRQISIEKGLLLTAIKLNKIKFAESLIEHGIQINDQDEDGKTPLMYAALSRNQELILKLAYNYAHPNIQDKYGNTFLHYVVLSSDVDMVRRVMILFKGVIETNIKN